MGILDFMERAIRVEAMLSECYRAMSARCEPKYAALMTEFCVDETNHEKILRLGKAFIAVAPDFFGRTALPRAGLNAGRQILASLLEGVQSERDGWWEGLAKLWELETLLEGVHKEVSFVINDPTLRALFKGLSAGSQNHVAALAGILNESSGRQTAAPYGPAAASL